MISSQLCFSETEIQQHIDHTGARHQKEHLENLLNTVQPPALQCKYRAYGGTLSPCRHLVSEIKVPGNDSTREAHVRVTCDQLGPQPVIQ